MLRAHLLETFVTGVSRTQADHVSDIHPEPEHDSAPARRFVQDEIVLGRGEFSHGWRDANAFRWSEVFVLCVISDDLHLIC